MSTKLEEIIDAAQELSPKERLDLIKAISRSLQDYWLGGIEGGFWQSIPLEERIARQRTPVIKKIMELRAEFWPEDETADDVITYIYSQRESDRLA
jgi:hypothetical protein